MNYARSVYLITYLKLILWTTSSKIVEHYINNASIGIHQCSMKNTLKFLLYTTSTRSVQRVGLSVNGKLNTQLNLDI